MPRGYGRFRQPGPSTTAVQTASHHTLDAASIFGVPSQWTITYDDFVQMRERSMGHVRPQEPDISYYTRTATEVYAQVRESFRWTYQWKHHAQVLVVQS